MNLLVRSDADGRVTVTTSIFGKVCGALMFVREVLDGLFEFSS